MWPVKIIHPLRGFPKTSLRGNRTCARRHGQGRLQSKREPADAGAKVEVSGDLKEVVSSRYETSEMWL